MTSSDSNGSGWFFLTNHAHVLICVDGDPGVRLRDIADTVGITERSAHKILSELIDEGYVDKAKVGRRNTYSVQPDLSMRHPLLRDSQVGDLLKIASKPS